MVKKIKIKVGGRKKAGAGSAATARATSRPAQSLPKDFPADAPLEERALAIARLIIPEEGLIIGGEKAERRAKQKLRKRLVRERIPYNTIRNVGYQVPLEEKDGLLTKAMILSIEIAQGKVYLTAEVVEGQFVNPEGSSKRASLLGTYRGLISDPEKVNPYLEGLIWEAHAREGLDWVSPENIPKSHFYHFWFGDTLAQLGTPLGELFSIIRDIHHCIPRYFTIAEMSTVDGWIPVVGLGPIPQPSLKGQA